MTPAAVSSLDTFLKVLPSLLVVGGWVVIYRLQAVQSRRKMLREYIEETREAIADLLETALRFHTDTRTVTDGMLLLGKFTDIERRLCMLPRMAQSRWAYPKTIADPSMMVVDLMFLVRLRQAITLDHFDDPLEAPLAFGAPQLGKIASASSRLTLEVDQCHLAAMD